MLRNLENGLLDFPGCALVVSHDRFFLDRVCNHIIAFEEDQIISFYGNYAEYSRDREVRLGKEKRMKFIKLK